MTLTQKLMAGAATTALTLGTMAPAFAADKWDMPMAYSASNFHSVNGVTFAECVGAGTNGDITIDVHPGGSLFAGADIKRAIQTGQV
ncbi:MAG: C4-dicarboxylate ABC transporter substrate-binding protein, partial [Roseobacter sp.]